MVEDRERHEHLGRRLRLNDLVRRNAALDHSRKERFEGHADLLLL